MKTNLMITTTLIAMFALLSGSLSAQTKDEAGTAYNAARTLVATDKAGALKGMIDVVAMCEKIGTEADDIKRMAINVIPDWQYQIANDFVKDKKYDEAIAAYNQTIVLSDKYNDTDKKEKSQNQLVKLYALKGQEELKAENADGAIANYDKAISLNPNYTKAYYSKGLAYKKKNDFDNMQKSMDKAIELAGKENDTATVNKARESVAASLLARANKAMTSKNYGQAIELANSSLNYNSTKGSTYLILALSYNSTSKFDQAIDACNKGVALETAADKQADFYFQLGKAYEGKKDTANACASYKKVSAGPNKAAAAYQMTTVLKCK